MVNKDQKTIFLKEAYDKITVICTKFQYNAGASDIEVTTLFKRTFYGLEKDIAHDYHINCKVWNMIFSVDDSHSVYDGLKI